MPEELASMKAQVYKDPRPKEYFDRFHERSRTREPDWVYEAVRIVTSLYAWTFFRARGIAAENVPTGPVIIAPNHFSFMDHFFVGAFIRRRVRFMAKSQLFAPADAVHLHARRRLPRAARLPRRRGVHHRQLRSSSAAG